MLHQAITAYVTEEDPSTRQLPNAGLMLARRHRRRPSINPALSPVQSGVLREMRS